MISPRRVEKALSIRDAEQQLMASQHPEDAHTHQMEPRDVLAALNAYTGNNVWGDVLEDILTQDEWDDAPDDRFTHNGVKYEVVPPVDGQGLARWRLA